MFGSAYLEADWRREALRTNLWVVPSLETVAITLLFVVTFATDRAAYAGHIKFPEWVLNGTADTARVILTTIAAAIITVIGIVFSITIVVLTLASFSYAIFATLRHRKNDRSRDCWPGLAPPSQ